MRCVKKCFHALNMSGLPVGCDDGKEHGEGEKAYALARDLAGAYCKGTRKRLSNIQRMPLGCIGRKKLQSPLVTGETRQFIRWAGTEMNMEWQAFCLPET